MSGWLTGWYLGGINTVIQNTLDKYRNIIDHGLYAYKDSVALIKDKDKRKDINRIIALSGITQFSDFFSQSMVNGIANASVERNVHEGIISSMILYHSKQIKFKGNPKKLDEAQKEMKDTIEELLRQSKSFIKAGE